MSVRQYIGARYVPIFGRVGEESAEWDNSAPYEPLTVVLYQGNSYTSRQYVPVGIPITDTAYWAQTGNFNSQVEAYRAEVQTFDDRITANADDIAAEEQARIQAVAAEAQARTEAIAAETQARTEAIDAEEEARIQADETETTQREQAIASLRANLQNSIRVFDFAGLLNVNSEINVSDVDSIFVIYDTVSRNLFFNGVIRATDSFTRGTNTTLFRLPSAIPTPNTRIFVYAGFECFDNSVGNVGTNRYLTPLTITTDGDVVISNLAGFSGDTQVKNIVFTQPAIPLANFTDAPV